MQLLLQKVTQAVKPTRTTTAILENKQKNVHRSEVFNLFTELALADSFGL